MQPLPDKEQSCDVANALSAASLFTRAKKVGGSRLIQPTPVPSLTQRQILQQVQQVQHPIRTFAQTISPFGKNPREFSEIFFYVEYLTMSEYLTRFPRQN